MRVGLYNIPCLTGAPCNASDQPTYLTLISLGQEWTPFTPISSLPFYIEVHHQTPTFMPIQPPTNSPPASNLCLYICTTSWPQFLVPTPLRLHTAIPMIAAPQTPFFAWFKT